MLIDAEVEGPWQPKGRVDADTDAAIGKDAVAMWEGRPSASEARSGQGKETDPGAAWEDASSGRIEMMEGRGGAQVEAGAEAEAGAGTESLTGRDGCEALDGTS